MIVERWQIVDTTTGSRLFSAAISSVGVCQAVLLYKVASKISAPKATPDCVNATTNVNES